MYTRATSVFVQLGIFCHDKQVCGTGESARLKLESIESTFVRSQGSGCVRIFSVKQGRERKVEGQEMTRGRRGREHSIVSISSPSDKRQHIAPIFTALYAQIPSFKASHHRFAFQSSHCLNVTLSFEIDFLLWYSWGRINDWTSNSRGKSRFVGEDESAIDEACFQGLFQPEVLNFTCYFSFETVFMAKYWGSFSDFPVEIFHRDLNSVIKILRTEALCTTVTRSL